MKWKRAVTLSSFVPVATGTLKIFGSQGHIAYPHLSNNPISTLIKICNTLKKKPLDKGNRNFQPSNLEFTSIDVNNNAHNVIPATAIAKFNIRFNNLQTTSSLRKKISRIVSTTCKKNKCVNWFKFSFRKRFVYIDCE